MAKSSATAGVHNSFCTDDGEALGCACVLCDAWGTVFLEGARAALVVYA